MTEKKATEVHIVLDGGHPRWARLDRTTAMADAQKLILEKYRKMGSSEVFGLPPPDASWVIPWWHNKVQPQDRVTVQSIPLKDWDER